MAIMRSVGSVSVERGRALALLTCRPVVMVIANLDQPPQ